MNIRLCAMFLLFVFTMSHAYGQKVNANFEDTVYYNIDFKKTKTKYVSYYRPPVIEEGDRYKVEYYTADHIPVLKGYVRPVKVDNHFSIEPLVAIKDGFFTLYNTEGTKWCEGDFIDNREGGEWKYYYKDGRIRRTESYYKEQPMLYRTSYYQNGNKLMEGLKVRVAYGKDTSFKEHKQWLYYHENEKISSIKNYYFGVPEGMNIYYDSNGVKKAEGMVKYKVATSYAQQPIYYTNTSKVYIRKTGKTLKDGLWTFYNDGKVESIQKYNEGLLDSDFVVYHTPTGKLKMTGRYHKGVKKGIWTIYYEGSEKIRSKIEFDDNNRGRAVFFDSANNDRIILEGKIDKNMRVGEWIRYYPQSGQVMSREYYSKNLLNGTCIGYDNSGALSSEVEYKNGLADGKGIYYYKGTKEKWVVLEFAADTFTGFVNTYYENGKSKRKTRDVSGNLQQVCYDRNGKIIDCLPYYTPASFDGDVMTYIGNNLEYPEEAKQMQLEGKVKVGFMIDEFGKIRDPYIIEGFDARCDEAALKLVSQMPNWIPSTIEDIPVKSYKTLPIVFWLPPEEHEATEPEAGM